MNKEAYKFLNSARVLHWRWLRLKSKRDELQLGLLPQGIRYDKDRVQTSPEDPMSKICAEIGTLEKKMNELQSAKLEQIEKIDAELSKLESEEQRTALSMRYINRTPVSKIAEAMGYAESTIYKFMNQGGDEIAKSIRNIK